MTLIPKPDICRFLGSIIQNSAGLRMSEKLCLKWNDFQDNTINTFARLGDSLDFSDVTLVCEDGKQVEAHKVVLACSSPVFQNILKRNKHAHPLLYMRGMKSEDLFAILEFLYCGETNVYQENLDYILLHWNQHRRMFGEYISTCQQTYYPSWKLIKAFVPSLWLCQSPSTDLLISTQTVIHWEGRPLNSINFRPKSLSKGKGWFGFRKLEVEGRRDGRSEAALWSKASKMALNIQRHSSVRTTLYQRVLSNICKQ